MLKALCSFNLIMNSKTLEFKGLRFSWTVRDVFVMRTAVYIAEIQFVLIFKTLMECLY